MNSNTFIFGCCLYSSLAFCLQLERLKNENSLAHEDRPSESEFPGLEHQLMQLHKVVHKFINFRCVNQHVQHVYTCAYFFR